MNVNTLLANFLDFVSPKDIHKTRIASLCAALQSLVSNGKKVVVSAQIGISATIHFIMEPRLIHNASTQINQYKTTTYLGWLE